MASIYDVALEACDEAGECRVIEHALRALDALDLTGLDADHAAALEFVLLDAIADRLHAMGDRLEARQRRAYELRDEAQI